jgi:hypothetical protein
MANSNNNGLFMRASQPDDDEDSGPETEDASEVLPLPDSGPNSYANWLARIERAKEVNEDKLEKSGDANQRRYNNQKRTGQHDNEMLVPSTFSRIESKKSLLIAQNPFVNVSAKHPNAVAVAPLMEAVINDFLGAPVPEGVDAFTMFRECLHDTLVPAGFWAAHIFYEAFIPPDAPTKEVQIGTKPDPKWVPPDLSTLPPGQPPPQPPQVPNMETVPNVVFEQYHMDRVSPRKVLWSDTFHGSDYDRSPWVGYHDNMDFYKGKVKWKLPDDFDTFAGPDTDLVDADPKVTGDKHKQIHFTQIYYYASQYDKTVTHPYQIRSLVLVDGIEGAVYHKDLDFQWRDEDGVLGGMVGFPLHIGSLRAVSDSAFPQPDATMWKYQDTEISDGRTDMKMQRRGSVPTRAANIGLLKEGGLGKLERGIYQGILPFPAECFGDGGKFIRVDVVPQAQFPQINMDFDSISNRDMDAVAGLGSAPSGSIPSGTTSTSATQAGAAQSASGSRIGLERNVLYHWYARAVQKLSVLLQHFMTESQFVTMLDDNGAKQLVEWSKDNIQGRFTFEIEGNSSVDQSEQRNEFMQWYNLVGKDPLMDHKKLDMALCRVFGKNPQDFLAPPPPAPEPPKPALPHGITLTLKGSDCNPLSPEWPILLALLEAAGIALPPAVLQAAQAQAAHTGLPVAATGQQPPPPPGPMLPPKNPGGPGAPPPLPIGPQVGQPVPEHGSADKASPIDKHAEDRTGNLPGPHILSHK